MRWMLGVGTVVVALVTACSDGSSSGGAAGTGGTGAADGAGGFAGGGTGGSAGAGGSAGTAGTGGAAGASGAGGTAGSGGGTPSCSGVTGTFNLTGVRDQSNTGSCPNTLTYPTPESVAISSQTFADGGQAFTAIFSGAATAYPACSINANTSTCKLNITCQMNGKYPNVWHDEIAWTVTTTGLSGTEAWSDYKPPTSGCTANWLTTGTKQ